MWKCHKCGKPVYFAERKQSLGYDWHPECLRCEECCKRLNPGQHAEHKGVPYCHVPCYGALFGPQLFGHGTRVESHTSFGKVENRSGGPNMLQSHLESKLKLFNQFCDGNSGEIRSREVNGRLVLEGALRIHWGVLGLIHLKEDDDQRTVITIRKRNSCRSGIFNGVDFEVSDGQNAMDGEASDTASSVQDSGLSDITGSVLDSGLSDVTSSALDSGLSDVTDASLETVSITSEDAPRSMGARTLPLKLDARSEDWDELDELLQVERRVDDCDKLYQTMPTGLPSNFSTSSSDRSNSISTQSSVETPDCEEGDKNIADTSHDIYEETLEKNLNRSLSGPDCLQRNRNGSVDEPNPRRIDLWSRNPGDEAGLNNAVDVEANKLQRLNLDDLPDGRSRKLDHGLDSDDSTIEYDDNSDHGEVVVRRAVKTGSTAIRRRPGKRRSRTALKRRCSINGHFYDRETSFFTPPRGSNMSVWVTSLVSTQEVVNLLLDKYKVDSRPANFALFVVRDNGEQRRLRDDEYPLLVRVMLGPHEDVAKLFIMDKQNTEEISSDVAQFLNLSSTECRAILERYRLEEEKETKRVRARFREMHKRIKQRMEDLKVRL